jgi:hypothetical protein
MEEADEPLRSQPQRLMWVRAQRDEGLHDLAFERTGGERRRYHQVGVSAGKASSVEEGVGPELIQGGQEAAGVACLFLLECPQGAHLLVNEYRGGGREVCGLTKPACQEVADRAEVQEVAFAERAPGLEAIEFDLVGIEEDVAKARRGCAIELRLVALQQLVCPVLVIDACGLVAEDDETRLVLCDESVESGRETRQALLERGELQRLGEQATIAGVEGRPVHILADVERDDEDLLRCESCGELAKGFGMRALEIQPGLGTT